MSLQGQRYYPFTFRVTHQCQNGLGCTNVPKTNSVSATKKISKTTKNTPYFYRFVFRCCHYQSLLAVCVLLYCYCFDGCVVCIFEDVWGSNVVGGRGFRPYKQALVAATREDVTTATNRNTLHNVNNINITAYTFKEYDNFIVIPYCKFSKYLNICCVCSQSVRTLLCFCIPNFYSLVLMKRSDGETRFLQRGGEREEQLRKKLIYLRTQ